MSDDQIEVQKFVRERSRILSRRALSRLLLHENRLMERYGDSGDFADKAEADSVFNQYLNCEWDLEHGKGILTKEWAKLPIRR